jgi:hypothetical protein
MPVFLDMLFSKAFSTGHGIDYNRVSYELREKHPDNPIVIYEVVLKEGHSWEHLRDNVYPSIVRYLQAKRLNPETGKGLIVTLFFNDRFHMIECPDFMEVYREMENLGPESFRFRIRQWLL